MKREVLIALFAAITLAISIWGYKFISGKNLFSGDHNYYAYYDNVKDVNTATPVLINGYEVGTVIDISPDPEDVKRIRIDFTVKRKIKLPQYTIAQLMPESPLGGKIIELKFDKMCDGSNCAENKSELKGEAVGMLGAFVDDEELETTVEAVSTIIDSTLGKLGEESSKDAIDVSIRNLATTLENFAAISEKFNTLMSRSQRDMEKTLSNVSELTSHLVESNDKINTMLDDLSVVTEDLKKAQLSETINTTNSTMAQAEESLKTMETTMSEANTSIAEINGILDKVSKGEGSLGKLVNDEELYENIESTTRNMNLLIQDLRLNPRRYFRLFGKKSKEYKYPQEDPAFSDDGK